MLVKRLDVIRIFFILIYSFGKKRAPTDVETKIGKILAHSTTLPRGKRLGEANNHIAVSLLRARNVSHVAQHKKRIGGLSYGL
jgi:hypothetical protein